MIQLFGSGFGQDASTVKVGTSAAMAGWEDKTPNERETAAQKVVAARDAIRMKSSRLFHCG
jgi:hypothetical protein